MNNFTINSTNSEASVNIADYLYNELKNIYISKRPIIFLCIGTDRSTGDSVGPLIGYKLRNVKSNNIFIYGSLSNPIHSKNLVSTLEKIHSEFKNPFIVAIDACLGSLEHVGKIFISRKPLSPGLVLNKDLPKVGDMSITGIVNISSGFDFIILQNTRLCTVMNIADSIAEGIHNFILKCNNMHLSINQPK